MSVQNLRKTYIDKGKLTVCRNAKGKPYIDLAECLKVFPGFALTSETPVAGNPVASGMHELQQQNETLHTEIDNLRERLQEEEKRRRQAEEREFWLRNHVDDLTQEKNYLLAVNLRLMAAPAPQKKSRWFGWLS